MKIKRMPVGIPCLSVTPDTCADIGKDLGFDVSQFIRPRAKMLRPVRMDSHVQLLVVHAHYGFAADQLTVDPTLVFFRICRESALLCGIRTSLLD